MKKLKAGENLRANFIVFQVPGLTVQMSQKSIHPFFHPSVYQSIYVRVHVLVAQKRITPFPLLQELADGDISSLLEGGCRIAQKLSCIGSKS